MNIDLEDANNILEALLEIEDDIKDFDIMVFAATKEVLENVRKKSRFLKQ